MLPVEFESTSKPREGFMIGHYTTGAFCVLCSQNATQGNLWFPDGANM